VVENVQQPIIIRPMYHTVTHPQWYFEVSEVIITDYW